MDLKHLQTFLTLCEIKNFTKTADILHYAQSNVTSQIQQLEKELNTKLFERIGKRVTLTQAGSELISYAQNMLHTLHDIKRKYANAQTGCITIGASESICIFRLPEIIKCFKKLHPDVELRIKVLDTDDFVSLLQNNTIDIAFVFDELIKHPAMISTLQIQEQIAAFATQHHPLTKKKNITIQDFENQQLILTSKECCYRKRFEQDLSKEHVAPRIVLETSSLQIIKQTVLSGLGICILPQLAVQKELDAHTLYKLNFSTNYKFASQLIYHKDKWLSQYLKDFISIVTSLSSI